jgi:hypothetical protein
VAFSANAKTDEGIAGTTITKLQPLYKNDGVGMDGRMYLGDANSSPVTANIAGLAMHGALAGDPIKYCYEDQDLNPGFTVDPSAAGDSGVYVLSATAGGIAPMDDLASGMYPVVLFVYKSASKVAFKILKAVTGALTA